MSTITKTTKTKTQTSKTKNKKAIYFLPTGVALTASTIASGIPICWIPFNKKKVSISDQSLNFARNQYFELGIDSKLHLKFLWIKSLFPLTKKT